MSLKSRPVAMLAALVLALLLLPAASAQSTPTRSISVDVVVEDGGPEGGPVTLTLDPAVVPVDIEVTCSGPEIPAKLVRVDVSALVEDAEGAPIDEIVLRLEPQVVEFTFNEQACALEDETQNETVEVMVVPGHVSIYQGAIRVAVSAVVNDLDINETATFHVVTGLEGQASLTFPALAYETDVGDAYPVQYNVLNDMNTEVKVIWDDVPEGLRHDVAPAPFVACNSHDLGCTSAGLTGSFDVVPPEGSSRAEEEVSLGYTITPASDEGVVIAQGASTLTFVYDPGTGGGDDEESPAPVFAFVLLVALLGALVRRRGI